MSLLSPIPPPPHNKGPYFPVSIPLPVPSTGGDCTSNESDESFSPLRLCVVELNQLFGLLTKSDHIFEPEPYWVKEKQQKQIEFEEGSFKGRHCILSICWGRPASLVRRFFEAIPNITIEHRQTTGGRPCMYFLSSDNFQSILHKSLSELKTLMYFCRAKEEPELAQPILIATRRLNDLFYLDWRDHFTINPNKQTIQCRYEKLRFCQLQGLACHIGEDSFAVMDGKDEDDPFEDIASSEPVISVASSDNFESFNNAPFAMLEKTIIVRTLDEGLQLLPSRRAASLSDMVADYCVSVSTGVDHSRSLCFAGGALEGVDRGSEKAWEAVEEETTLETETLPLILSSPHR